MSSSKRRRIRARTTRVRANQEGFEQELHEFEQTKKASSKNYMSSSKHRRLRARTIRVRAKTEGFEQELHEFEQTKKASSKNYTSSSKDGVELKVLVYLNESMLDVH